MDRIIIVTEPFSVGKRAFGKGIHTVSAREQDHPFLAACEKSGRFVWAEPEEPVEPEMEPDPVPEGEPTPEPSPASEPVDEDLVAAIARLADEHFTEAGRPGTKGLSDLVGRPVTAAERDAAWTAFQAAKA